jgi:hypothetical protein
MIYDVVVGAGCSFMNGDTIKNETGGNWDYDGVELPTKPRPVKFLSKLLNIDEVNISHTGSSNERIMRNIYEWVEFNTKYKNPLIIIGLSGLARYAYKNEDTNRVFDLHPASINGYRGEDLVALNKKVTNGNSTTKELQDWVHYYMRYFFNQDFEEKKLQRELVTLSYYLKAKGCDYRIHNSLEDNLGGDNGVDHRLNFISFRDKDYKGPDTWNGYLRWQHTEIDKNIQDNLSRSQTPPYGLRFCGGHPSPNAGMELAQRIYKYL